MSKESTAKAKKAPGKKPTKPAAKKTRGAKVPVLYQAITDSYRLRQILHAMRADDTKTLCGRKVKKGSKQKFDETQDGTCLKCIQSINVMERAHPGWE